MHCVGDYPTVGNCGGCLPDVISPTLCIHTADTSLEKEEWECFFSPFLHVYAHLFLMEKGEPIRTVLHVLLGAFYIFLYRLPQTAGLHVFLFVF